MDALIPNPHPMRLREICTKHGILLIFDEVITGFGRLGTWFAADYFGVIPDMITVAKGLTNGTVPMGAVLVKREIHDAFMHGSEQTIELPHGCTYSGHPIACAAAIATLNLYEESRMQPIYRSIGKRLFIPSVSLRMSLIFEPYGTAHIG